MCLFGERRDGVLIAVNDLMLGYALNKLADVFERGSGDFKNLYTP